MLSKVIDDAIRSALAPVLKQDGYRKSAHTWRSVLPDHTRIVHLTTRLSEVLGTGQFRIELGVYWPAVEQIMGHSGTTSMLGKERCLWYCSLGALGRADHWWSMNRSTDPSDLGNQLLDAWVAQGRPWLAQCGSLTGLKEYFAKLDGWATSHMAAAVALVMKQPEEATRLLSEAVRRNWNHNDDVMRAHNGAAPRILLVDAATRDLRHHLLVNWGMEHGLDVKID